jgi:hypothetical protein
VVDPNSGTWYLKDSAAPGAPDITPFRYGAPTWVAVTGDWNGKGITTIGVVDLTTETWYLRSSNNSGASDITPFRYGAPGWIPVAGDWDGNGITTIGVVDPATETWYLRNSNASGPPDIAPFRYGAPGWTPVVGDWNGRGKTSIGVIDPGTMTWYLKSTTTQGPPDFTPFRYGAPGWTPIVGDWDGNGSTTIGEFDPNGTWYLRNSNSSGAPDISPFRYGGGNWQPLAGHWVSPGLPLQAAGGPRADVPGGPRLSAVDLQMAVAGALRRLRSARVDSALIGQLAGASYAVEHLPAALLGQAIIATNTVEISDDAAGYGWFLDQTPLQDEEFNAGVALPGTPADGRMDLLTAVLHEMGHLAGRPDLDSAGHPFALMADSLAPGIRHVQALDQVFARRSF